MSSINFEKLPRRNLAEIEKITLQEFLCFGIIKIENIKEVEKVGNELMECIKRREKELRLKRIQLTQRTRILLEMLEPIEVELEFLDNEIFELEKIIKGEFY